MPDTTPLTIDLFTAYVIKAQRIHYCDYRAPIVKTSRRIPPTPVAAPWYGSI